LYKNFKIHKIKNHSDMFRIVCDLSSGSREQYLTEIRSGSLMFVVCLVGVWQRNFEPVVCVRYDGLVVCVCTVRRSGGGVCTVHIYHWFRNYAAKHRPSTRQTSVKHYEFQSRTALYSLMMDRIRSETCRSDF